MEIVVRPETPQDYPAITKINDLAFEQPNEGRLIEKLRHNKAFISRLSLVAEVEGRVVGHILFFPIEVKEEEGIVSLSLALAPMAVSPEFQKRGIGGRLIMSGLEMAQKLHHRSAIVLGHAEYYSKFGFKPASLWNIRAPFDVPNEAFMAIELTTNGLKDVEGTVLYPNEFGEV